MIDGIEAATTLALTRALDRSSLQHRAIATNIANATTPGFVPVRAQFESMLQSAAAGLAESGRPVWREASQVPAAAVPVMEPLRQEDGSPAAVRIDAEVADLGRNAVQYQTLLRALDRHMSILSMAVGDGKR